MKTFTRILSASKLQVLFLLTTTASLINGCATSSEPKSAQVAGAGSTFTFKAFEIDSAGDLSFPYLMMDSIEATGLNVTGMLNVSRVGEKTGGSFDDFDFFIG